MVRACVGDAPLEENTGGARPYSSSIVLDARIGDGGVRAEDSTGSLKRVSTANWRDFATGIVLARGAGNA